MASWARQPYAGPLRPLHMETRFSASAESTITKPAACIPRTQQSSRMAYDQKTKELPYSSKFSSAKKILSFCQKIGVNQCELFDFCVLIFFQMTKL